MSKQRYHWRILQQGALSLGPDGASYNRGVEHRCTVTLVWPEGARPERANTVMFDPCFSDTGYWDAVAEFDALGAMIDDVGRVFTTHLHHDHMLHLPYSVQAPHFRSLRPEAIRESDPLAGLRFELCPGHHPLLIAPSFIDSNGRAVWVASDAILNLEWLRAWQYYTPNRYNRDEVIETWRSLACILSEADIVIPGHGPALEVSAGLLAELLESFPHAPYAARCPDVAEMLQDRLARLEVGEA